MTKDKFVKLPEPIKDLIFTEWLRAEFGKSQKRAMIALAHADECEECFNKLAEKYAIFIAQNVEVDEVRVLSNLERNAWMN